MQLLKETTPHPVFSYLIYLGCAIAFCTIPFGSDTGRNLFYVASYISFIAVCLNLKYYFKNKKNLIVPVLFFCVGMGSIFWLQHFKQPRRVHQYLPLIHVDRQVADRHRLYSADCVK
jgi:O-antigen ligase